jgi:hypothetical protein
MKEWVENVLILSSKQPKLVSIKVSPTCPSSSIKQPVGLIVINSRRTPTEFDGWCTEEEDEELPSKMTIRSCTENDMPPFNMRPPYASSHNFFSIVELEQDDFRSDSTEGNDATVLMQLQDTKQLQESAERAATDNRMAEFVAFMDCVDVATVFV